MKYTCCLPGLFKQKQLGSMYFSEVKVQWFNSACHDCPVVLNIDGMVRLRRDKQRVGQTPSQTAVEHHKI